MAYAVKVEVEYVDFGSADNAIHTQTLALQDKVPFVDDKGDPTMSYEQYKAIAVQKAIEMFTGEWVTLPINESGDFETVAIPRTDVLSIRAKVVKTLDVA
jgi:hypothetical protein